MSRVKRCKGDGSAVNRGVARRAFMCIDCWFDLDLGRKEMVVTILAGLKVVQCVGAGDVVAGAVHGDFPEQLVLREQELGLDVEDFSPLLVAPKMAVAEMRFRMEFWWKKF
ncbi:hypothetical protein F0562_017627 [Nyssa sinensis]|uniref:Uncharacterized protein n=1 Tax=Nyssa sinensis TaxID=561372 RepID=A0A5J4ZHF8_9ASTE|nr:hypothetical protein F0562_017627 [Nyssa sinensis]